MFQVFDPFQRPYTDPMERGGDVLDRATRKWKVRLVCRRGARCADWEKMKLLGYTMRKLPPNA